MKITWITLAVRLCVVVADVEKTTGRSVLPTPAEEEFQAAAVATVNYFGKRIYQVLCTKRGNFAVSPLSAVLLSLLWGGAGGRTAQELGSLLQLPDDFAAVQIGFYSLLRELQGLENTGALHIAQRIYLQEGTHIVPAFKTAARNFFLLNTNEINFAMDPETSRKTINNWIQDKTRNRIKELLRPGMVNSNTKMLLLSGLHLKSRWTTPFTPDKTTTESFHINLAVSRQVKMMHLQHTLRYAVLEELDATMLEVPFEAHGLHLLILLPISFSGVRRMETRFSAFNIAEAVNRLQPCKVNVSLPKFAVEKTIMLNSILEELGMWTMFQYSANFSGIAKHDVLTSKVIQRVSLHVEETGIEAAAAALRLDSSNIRSEEEPEIEFKADHPFLYMVYESITGTFLFIGRFVEPQ